MEANNMHPPKNVSERLLHLFYRLKYQRTPSWFNGLSESEVNKWRSENPKEAQINTVRALNWVVKHPEAILTDVLKNMNRNNEEIHIFCKNFLDSLEKTLDKKAAEELYI